jgi:hypothetical protein
MTIGLAALLAFEPASAEQRLPADVARFLERREGCDHWAGEEPYDADRRREIEAAIRKLRCTSMERDAAGLGKRYAGRKEIVAKLAETKE